MMQQTAAAGGTVRACTDARVLVVDDSVVARAAIARMIDAMSGFAVVASVSDVRSALKVLTDTAIDLILLDLEMPGIGGLAALPELLAAGQGAKVLVVSSAAEDGAAAAIQALALGAADTLVKPGIGNLAGRFAAVLEDRMRRLLDGAAAREPVRHAQANLPGEFDIVAVGASTGGIHALSQMLRAIPAGFRRPILVTQHLPASFMNYFAMQLAVLAGRPCQVAEDHMRVREGRVYVAPGHAHLRCARTSDGVALRLSDEVAVSGCTPSVDPMLESVAQVYGPRGLAVILSGMGRDGAGGAAQLVEAGGSLIVQDKPTSVVWGMPGAIAERAAAVLPPAQIGELIASGRRPA